MTDFYFTSSNARVLLKGTTDPVWIDDAFGITYEAESRKHPLYGYGDIQFRKMVQGRELITGHLILNYRYKNQLTYALMEIPVKSTDTLGVVPNWKNIMAQAIDAKAEVSTIVLASSFSPVNNFDERITLEDTTSVIQGTKVDENIGAFSKYSMARNEAIRLGVSADNFDKLNDAVIKALAMINSMEGAPSISVQDLISRLGAVQEEVLGIDLYDGIITPIKEAFLSISELVEKIDEQLKSNSTFDSAVAERYKNSLWRRSQRSNTEIPAPYARDLYKSGQIDLIIEFGHPEEFNVQAAPDHKVTLENVGFSGQAQRIFGEDDDDLKIAFPFIARSVK